MSQDVKKVGVTQKALVINKEGKFLTIRRSKTAPTHPLHWDLPGGELEYGEDPVAGIVREVKEESGIEVKNVRPFDVFSREHSFGFWVTIAYSCEAVSNKVVLSFEHDDFKWITKEEFLKLRSWDKIIRFVKNSSI